MSTIIADLEHLTPGSERPAIIMQEYGKPSLRRGEYEMSPTRIADGRQAGHGFSLDENGFAFLHSPTDVVNFDDAEEIEARYYSEIETLIKAQTGAVRVDIFDHTIRHSKLKPGVRGVAAHVHNDYTEWSLPQKLRDHLGNKTADEILQRRVVQINAWRPLMEPVKVAPLAIADAGSVPFEDLIACDLVYPDRVGEIYELKANPEHRWFYFPEMKRDEVILIKGYDSDQNGKARFAPHSAFNHPDTKSGDPDRISIEVRAIASF